MQNAPPHRLAILRIFAVDSIIEVIVCVSLWIDLPIRLSRSLSDPRYTADKPATPCSGSLPKERQQKHVD